MRPRGFSLLEVMISAFIFSALIVVAFTTLRLTTRLTHTGETMIDLQEYGRKALETIAGDLREAGRVLADTSGDGMLDPVTDREYPRFGNFSNTPGPLLLAGLPEEHCQYCPHDINPVTPGCGVPPGYTGLNTFAHAGLQAADHISNNPLFQEPSREVIFIKAADLDGDGKPTTAAGNTIEWDFAGDPARGLPGEIAYVVDVDPSDQVNRIYRTTTTGERVSIAGYVERLVVADYGAPDPDGTPGLTGNQVRVTLYLAKPVGIDCRSYKQMSAADRAGYQVLETRISTFAIMRNSALE